MEKRKANLKQKREAMNKLGPKPVITKYRILARDIDKAKGLMNGRWYRFQSRVVEVVIIGDYAEVFTETVGSFPFVQGRWKEVIVADGVKTTNQVNAELKDSAEAKRGRGRPRGSR